MDHGEDLKTVLWPQKLIMHYCPRSCWSQWPFYPELKEGPVLLHQPGPGVPQKPLQPYSKGFGASCTCPRAAHILVLLFSHKKKTFRGLIPYHQNGFVNRIWQVLQQAG